MFSLNVLVVFIIKVAKIKEVTGASVDIARKLLADNDGNVDAAIAAKLAGSYRPMFMWFRCPL